MARSSPPRPALATTATRSNCGGRSCRTQLVSSRKLRAPVSAMGDAWRAVVVELLDYGRASRASSAGVLTTVETRSRKSCAAVSRLRSSLKVG